MGFFFEETMQEGKVDPTIKILHTLECKVCPLDKAALQHPKFLATGSQKARVYLLAAAPDEEDDKKGEQYRGEAGRVIRQEVPAKWKSRVRLNTTIRCWPLGSTPAPVEIECCRPSIIQDIEHTQPLAIFGFGKGPLHWIVGKADILAWRGRCVPVKIGQHVCWYFPMFDPAFVLLHEYKKPEYRATFERDMREAFALVEDLQPPLVIDTHVEQYQGIVCLDKGTDEEVKLLTRFLKPLDDPDVFVSVDFETTQLRPYGGSILSVALTSGGQTIAIPLLHPETRWTESQLEQVYKKLSWFFTIARCQKIAHNTGFELEWLYVHFGFPPAPIPIWQDTMMMAYCLDERRGMLNLNTVVYELFGFWLKDLSSLDVKNLVNESLYDVLLYNALDAKWTYHAELKLREKLSQKQLQAAYDFQCQRIPTMALTQISGLDVDTPLILHYHEEFEQKILAVQQKIGALPICQEFKQQFGHVLNPSSSTDLVKVFRDLLKCSEGWVKNKYSTDESVLSKIDHPLAALVLELRPLIKLQSTYFVGLAPGGKSLQADGRVHTVLNTTFTSTGRLSSEAPNIQNFPNRKDSWVRSIIIPPIDHKFVAIDYGQIEVRVIAMAAKDPVLIKMLFEKYDIHRAWGDRIIEMVPSLAKKYPDEKSLRGMAKNKIVFPAFYGAAPKSIAYDLGIAEGVCEELMQEFWKMFAGVKAWQEKVYAQYDAEGYVACLTGRRRHHPLSKNRIINSPIQGTASDIVVDVMTRLTEYAIDTGQPQYIAVINAHDDLSFALPNKTFDQDLEVIIGMMLHSPFDFVNVPLSVSVAVGPNWGDMKPIGDFYSDEWN